VKKMIAPIIIVILLLLYLSSYLYGITRALDFYHLPIIVRLIVVGIILSLIALVIYILIQRLREIKEEDEDDLGKY